MKFSTYHLSFSVEIDNERALYYPEEFLGPNWKNILNFWLFLDNLTEEQLKTISRHYWDQAIHGQKYQIANVQSGLITDYNVDIAWAGDIEDKCYDPSFIVGPIYELIASNLLLDQNHPLFFLNLLLDTLKTVS